MPYIGPACSGLFFAGGALSIFGLMSGCQVSSIDMVLALGARSCEFESRQYQCSREN